MGSIPSPQEVFFVYTDQKEALEFLWRFRRKILDSEGTAFSGLTEQELDVRLREDRQELDLWAVMMMTASFEAMLKSDLKVRSISRPKNECSKQVCAQLSHGKHITLKLLIEAWLHCGSGEMGLTPRVKKDIQRLRRWRNWIAHGRSWTENKSGSVFVPDAAIALIEDFCTGIRCAVADFPLS
jgi:hypothetical protein